NMQGSHEYNYSALRASAVRKARVEEGSALHLHLGVAGRHLEEVGRLMVEGDVVKGALPASIKAYQLHGELDIGSDPLVERLLPSVQIQGDPVLLGLAASHQVCPHARSFHVARSLGGDLGQLIDPQGQF